MRSRLTRQVLTPSIRELLWTFTFIFAGCLSLATIALIAIAAPRHEVGAQSITRFDSVEIAGTTDATGVVTARAGVRLTTPTTGPLITSGAAVPVAAGTLGSIYVRTSNPATLYQNTDGATTWTQISGSSLPSFTSGSVPYGAGSTLTQDNSNFFWDATNKRLGIGTSSPSVALDVRTTKANDGAVYVRNLSSTGFSGIAFFDSSNAFKSEFGYGNASAGTSFLQSKAFLYGDAPFVVTNTTEPYAYFDPTNKRVGIGLGTSAPSAALHVKTAEAGNTTVILQNTSGTGFTAIDMKESGGSQIFGFGHDNNQNRNFIDYTSDDLLFFSTGGAGGSNSFKMTNNPSLQFYASTAAVSDANTGRIRYTTSGQKFQTSANGASYADLVTQNSAGDVSIGTGAASVFTYNGDLLKFGNTSGAGATYVYNNTINAGYAQSGTFELALNYLSSAAGTSDFRNLGIYNGKGAAACTVTGSTKTMNCIGGLQVNGVNVAAFTNSDLQYSPLNDPSSPNALDDEFNGSSLDAKWTSFAGAGSVSNVVANSTVVVTKTWSSDCAYGYTESFSPGASAFVFEARLNMSQSTYGGGVFSSAAIGISDGTKYAFGGILLDGGTAKIGIQQWSTSTTFVGDSKTSLTLPNYSPVVTNGFTYTQDLWVRLERSGNDLIVSYSPNGYDFGQSTTYSGVLSGWGTITKAGFMGQSAGTGTVKPRFFYFRKIS